MNPEARRRQELGEFLKARRRQLARAELGLPPVTKKGPSGVRREEISYLSGVSITWYSWLEQGREIKPSRSETAMGLPLALLGAEPATAAGAVFLAPAPLASPTAFSRREFQGESTLVQGTVEGE